MDHTATMDSLGGDMEPAGPTRHESARRPHALAELIRSSPFLCLSLAVHLIILLLLAFITAGDPKPPQLAIVVPPEPYGELIADPLTIVRDTERVASQRHAENAPGVGQGGERFVDARDRTKPITPSKVKILGPISPVTPGQGEDFDKNERPGFRDTVSKKSVDDVSDAMNQFAVITINAAARGKTLVALLIDQSRSIVYGDLPRVARRMDDYFSDVDENLPTTLADNGRWVVVAYGRTAGFKCKPSKDLAYVKAALSDVEVDASGTENLGLAVKLVLDQYSDSDYKTILIAALTDESGDDIKDPALLENLISRMRKHNAHFFAFGYESTFCAQLKRITMVLDPNVVRGRDREAIRGFEGRTISTWSNGGPEAPRAELWWGEDWRLWNAWGGSHNALPSGFGMYEMNRMALATSGIYFLLKGESRYDEDKLYARYKPDICARPKYDRLMEEVPLRGELKAVWSEISRYYLTYDLRTPEQIQQQLDKSIAGRAYCLQRAGRLQELLRDSKPVGDNWARWQAHGDLTVAELLRFRFMLGQYHEALRQKWNETRHVVPEGKRFVLTRGRAPQDYVGPREAAQEHDAAQQYITLVIERHKGTPWEEAAKRLKGSVFPWKCDVIDLPVEPKGPKPTRNPTEEWPS